MGAQQSTPVVEDVGESTGPVPAQVALKIKRRSNAGESQAVVTYCPAVALVACSVPLEDEI